MLTRIYLSERKNKKQQQNKQHTHTKKSNNKKIKKEKTTKRNKIKMNIKKIIQRQKLLQLHGIVVKKQIKLCVLNLFVFNSSATV